ncbi:glycosyltransferase [candidate division WOR-3 bacterium]|uniref:Glycosyltransferase n=1 Tax=candidate division WOR-3 bacterium TaxID=2052148 RepID=A0A9D5K7V6_UNCW3|nr:glycosyltransferase [candidate division WOR-3 bacterium]MBD3363902.1 glycosyltransferase [candidate division WOR-3 bacterium]
MSKEKKVLIVSYYFPPMGGVGVQRVSKFCKYLPQFGWKPVVVTPEPSTFYMTDKGMMDEVKHAEIHRIKAPDSFRTHKRATGRDKPRIDSPLRKLARTLTWPDTHRGFARRALPVIKELSSEVQAILVTAPPFSSLLMIPGLKKKLDIPIIADMRDPWVSHPVHDRQAWKKGKNRAAEREALGASDTVIAATRTHTEDLKQRYPEMEERIYYIPNGYDTEDFSAKKGKRMDGALRIVYSGIMGLEGINDGSTLYAALRILKDKEGLRPSDLRFEIIGEVARKEEERMKDVEEFIDSPGFLPHKEAMARLERADLAYLPYHARYSYFIVPAKVYEYVGSGTPVLAEVDPTHETASILRDTGTGMIADEDDVDAVVKALRLLLKGRFPYRPKRQHIRYFDRRNEVEYLARLLNELTQNA